MTVEIPGVEKVHRYDFVGMRPIAARRVEKIPFSHPRQLFPVLRVQSPEYLSNLDSSTMV